MAETQQTTVKGRNISDKQKQILLEFMEENPTFCSGKFTMNFCIKDYQQMWGQLADILNSEGSGPIKTTRNWMNAWKDLKQHVKSKMAKVKRNEKQPGNGERDAVPLTDLENRIFALMGRSAIQAPSTGANALCDIIAQQKEMVTAVPIVDGPLMLQLVPLEMILSTEVPDNGTNHNEPTQEIAPQEILAVESKAELPESENENRKRGQKVSERQKKLMVEYMEANPEFFNAKYSHTFTPKDYQRMWGELTEKLNADGRGPEKNSKSWMACWKDLKVYVKGKIAKLKASLSKPGGGYSDSIKLNELEERISALLACSTNSGSNVTKTATEPSRLSIHEISPESTEATLIESLEDLLQSSSHSQSPTTEVVLEPSRTIDIPSVADEYSMTESVPGISKGTSCNTRRVKKRKWREGESVTAANDLIKEQQRTADALTGVTTAINRLAAAKEEKTAIFLRHTIAMEGILAHLLGQK